MKKIRTGCPPYEGTDPYLYFCFAEKDREAVFPLLEYLYLRGVRIWYNVESTADIRKLNRQQERMNQASLLVIYLTENARNDERVKTSLLYYQHGKPVIGIDTDDGDNELAFGMTARAQHVDGRNGRSPEELEADLIRTDGFSQELIGEPQNRMKLLMKRMLKYLIAAIIIALLAVAFLIADQQMRWGIVTPTPCTDADRDAHAHADADAHAHAYPDAHADAHPDAHADADTNADTDTDADPNADADTDTHPDADADPDADTHAESDPNADPDSGHGVFGEQWLTDTLREAVSGILLTEESLAEIKKLELDRLPEDLSELDKLPNLEVLSIPQNLADEAGEIMEKGISIALRPEGEEMP